MISLPAVKEGERHSLPSFRALKREFLSARQRIREPTVLFLIDRVIFTCLAGGRPDIHISEAADRRDHHAGGNKVERPPADDDGGEILFAAAAASTE